MHPLRSFRGHPPDAPAIDRGHGFRDGFPPPAPACTVRPAPSAGFDVHGPDGRWLAWFHSEREARALAEAGGVARGGGPTTAEDDDGDDPTADVAGAAIGPALSPEDEDAAASAVALELFGATLDELPADALVGSYGLAREYRYDIAGPLGREILRRLNVIGA